MSLRTLSACLLALALPAAALAEDEHPGVPKGETELMGKHDVDPASVSYRPGKGLTVSSADGKFSMTTRLRLQFLYTFEAEPGDEGPEYSHGFQIRRARLAFTGNLFGKNNKYKIELAFSPRDMGLKDGIVTRSILLDGYLDLTHLRDFSVRVGQWKVNYSLQRVVSSGNLEFVDRSIANSEFNLDRDLGIEFFSKDVGGLGYLRYHASVTTGEGHSSYDIKDFGMMYIARLVFFPMKTFSDYGSETDLSRSPRARLALGGAYAFIDDSTKDRGVLGSDPSDGGTTDFHNATADLTFRISGFSLDGEFFWRKGMRSPGPLVDELGVPLLDDEGQAIAEADPRDGLGFHVQAGYLIPTVPVGLAARYSRVQPLDTQSSLSEKNEVGGSLSWYIAHHPYKLQLDYFHTWDQSGISDGSDRLRLQLQASL